MTSNKETRGESYEEGTRISKLCCARRTAITTYIQPCAAARVSRISASTFRCCHYYNYFILHYTPRGYFFQVCKLNVHMKVLLKGKYYNTPILVFAPISRFIRDFICSSSYLYLYIYMFYVWMKGKKFLFYFLLHEQNIIQLATTMKTSLFHSSSIHFLFSLWRQFLCSLIQPTHKESNVALTFHFCAFLRSLEKERKDERKKKRRVSEINLEVKKRKTIRTAFALKYSPEE